MVKKSPRSRRTSGMPSAFKLAFFSVLFLTVLSLGVGVYLVTIPNQTEDVRRLSETCSTTWKLGFGAIVGLVGGKALP
jgi:hypothetical protein